MKWEDILKVLKEKTANQKYFIQKVIGEINYVEDKYRIP
jgi:hypothetical protein